MNNENNDVTEINDSFDEVSLNLNVGEIIPTESVQETEEKLQDVYPQKEEEEEVLTDKQIRKLVEFTTGMKELTQDEIDSLRKDEVQLEKLTRIAVAKQRHFNYNPKKHFGVDYKKKRQIKNKQAKVSRRANRS